MKVKKSKAISAYVPTASMADIAFLLIIFFMVASVFPLDKTQVDLPETKTVNNYNEDSAVIAITTDQLIRVREDINRNLADVAGNQEQIIIKGSEGLSESYQIYSANGMYWDMADQAQFDDLKNKMDEFIRKVERRREREGRQIIIVIKADEKTPFYAVDGVVQVLQELGGESSEGQGVAILSQPGG
jgi:biopolymer transport protein ExbD